MKKSLALAGLLVLVLLLPFISPACTSENVAASLGQQFTLPAGKSAVITGESLKIKFVEVTGDSRCPTGVQCIQAGDVKCLMLISYFDSQSSLVFTQLGGNDITTQDFNVYRITFKVEPYPQSGKQIKPEDYKMVMTVTKFQK
jgi:hypothetical protein